MKKFFKTLVIAIALILALLLSACNSSCEICGDSGSTHRVQGHTVCTDQLGCGLRLIGQPDLFDSILGS